MRILISNDDGYHAPGIQALANHLAELSHDVYVGAPDRERSTTGHCLTLHKPLHPTEVKGIYSPKVKKVWKINGTPCDSAKLTLNRLVDHTQIDVMLSGINRGPNMGADVLYSGTVSAALEGALYNIPSIAISLNSFDDLHYHTAAEFVGKFLEQINLAQFPEHNVLSVNVPAVEPEDVVGVKVTRLGRPRFKDVFEERKDPRGRDYYWQFGVVENIEEPGTDIEAVHQNFISVTPIHYDMTRQSSMEVVNSWNPSF